MKTIYKYLIPLKERSVVSMPQGAKVLTIQIQRGTICAWAEVDDGAPMTDRTFIIVGTGHEVPDGVTYLASVQSDGFVWHIYE